MAAKKKFKATPFKKWLDHLCAVVVKTRDDYTCQIQRPGCAGTMLPGDQNCQWCHIVSRTSNKTRWELLNALTGCGHCHQYAHSHPTQFGVWFVSQYPYRNDYLVDMVLADNKTWRQADFEAVEQALLEKAIDLECDQMSVNTKYRARFARKIHAMKYK